MREARGSGWRLDIRVHAPGLWQSSSPGVASGATGAIALRNSERGGPWIAYSGAVTKLHFDHMDNLLGVVSGRKRLILFDADQTKWIYPEGFLDSNFNFSKVDPENIDNVRFGDVRRAKYWECILAAGEMLYLPANYWHHVRSEGFCVSINTWFARASQYFTSAALRRASTMMAANLGLVANRGSSAVQRT